LKNEIRKGVFYLRYGNRRSTAEKLLIVQGAKLVLAEAGRKNAELKKDELKKTHTKTILPRIMAIEEV